MSRRKIMVDCATCRYGAGTQTYNSYVCMNNRPEECGNDYNEWEPWTKEDRKDMEMSSDEWTERIETALENNNGER